MSIYLVASVNKCIEVEASSILEACSIGAALLKEDWKYGYCRAIQKISDLKELLRKLNICYGEDFEYHGSPDYTLVVLREYAEKLVQNNN